jgi:hypothetical protein
MRGMIKPHRQYIHKMGETSKNTLEPTSLIMRVSACFYCGGSEAGAETVDHMFGIKCCKTHRSRAKRDCNAYLHRQGHVLLEDAWSNSSLKRLLEILQENALPVERTNGTVEDDWCLQTVNSFIHIHLSRIEGVWSLPVQCKRIKLYKFTPLMNFLRPDIVAKMKVPADWHLILESAMDTLVDGVYKTDAEAYDYARNHDESETIAETPGVTTILYEGSEQRIFVGHLIDEARPRENGTDRAEEIGDP